ncbi:hypothetical protein [Sinorhizobium sp. NFACC03]|uniref:hypothetical protein n=1 Tax=Sinorhizobium sp. NFACC03 TaxID=1566295 RepID=UPI00115FBD06|nr:hypothetical protein [Sinorhizobium sp. NFACC03]
MPLPSQARDLHKERAVCLALASFSRKSGARSSKSNTVSGGPTLASLCLNIQPRDCRMMWSGLLLSLLLSVSMAFSLTELSFVRNGRGQQSRGDAVRTTLAMSAGLTALGLAFSHQGPSLGVMAVIAGIALSWLAARFASRTVALAVAILSLGFYLQFAELAPLRP